MEIGSNCSYQMINNLKNYIVIVVVIFGIVWYFTRGKNKAKAKKDLQHLAPFAGITKRIPIIGGALNDYIDSRVKDDTPPKPHQQQHQEQLPEKPRRFKSENISSAVFARLIEEFGGNANLIEYNVRLKEITNPETGRPLEFDAFYPPWKLALEYNGRQHYYFTPHFHKNEDEFLAQMRRDVYKRELSKKYGICLIEVPYTVDTCDFDSNGKEIKCEITIQEKFKRLRSYIAPKMTAC